MLIGQSPFSGCDEDELFWSICNEIPWFPVYISAEATSILKGVSLEKFSLFSTTEPELNTEFNVLMKSNLLRGYKSLKMD